MKHINFILHTYSTFISLNFLKNCINILLNQVPKLNDEIQECFLVNKERLFTPKKEEYYFSKTQLLMLYIMTDQIEKLKKLLIIKIY